MEIKTSTEGKSEHRRKRLIKKGFQVRNEDSEGEMYASGQL